MAIKVIYYQVKSFNLTLHVHLRPGFEIKASRYAGMCPKTAQLLGSMSGLVN